MEDKKIRATVTSHCKIKMRTLMFVRFSMPFIQFFFFIGIVCYTPDEFFSNNFSAVSFLRVSVLADSLPTCQIHTQPLTIKFTHFFPKMCMVSYGYNPTSVILHLIINTFVFEKDRLKTATILFKVS